MRYIAVMYDWPQSQVCMDCEYGQAIQFSGFTYACIRYCLLNDGQDCMKKVKRKTVEQTKKGENHEVAVV